MNVTIGTDFSPGDILAEMRYTMLASRVADRQLPLRHAARRVRRGDGERRARRSAATIWGGWRPARRPTCVIFDLRQLHYGAVHDPIKSLVEVGSGTDVDLVLVDGKTIVRDGELATVDQAALLAAAHGEAEKLWADVPNWIWGGRTIEQVVPPAYPIV